MKLVKCHTIIIVSTKKAEKMMNIQNKSEEILMADESLYCKTKLKNVACWWQEGMWQMIYYQYTSLLNEKVWIFFQNKNDSHSVVTTGDNKLLNWQPQAN